MLISKRSRRKSAMFDSRFRSGEGVDFPLRQYLRCKEEFSGGVIHLILLVAFVITLLSFGKTLNNLFLNHGEDTNPAYRWMALGALLVFVLSILRRRQTLYPAELRAHGSAQEVWNMKTSPSNPFCPSLLQKLTSVGQLGFRTAARTCISTQ